MGRRNPEAVMVHSTTLSRVAVLLVSASLISSAAAQTGCGGSCSSDNDCNGQLACINSHCNDDPSVGTHICSTSGSPSPPTTSDPGNGNGCGSSCASDNDCPGQLACFSGKCNDDPSVGTHICSSSGTPGTGTPTPSGGSCQSSGFLTAPADLPTTCNTAQDSSCCVPGTRYPQYACSPAVSGATSAILTLNSFAAGGSGGAQSECDGQYHADSELVVALSTGWYNGGSRCGKMVQINGNGRSVRAKVVDECDSMHGCDSVHAFQPPCPYNDVDVSPAVWSSLGVSPSDSRYGMMPVTWSDVA